MKKAQLHEECIATQRVDKYLKKRQKKSALSVNMATLRALRGDKVFQLSTKVMIPAYCQSTVSELSVGCPIKQKRPEKVS